MSKIYLETLEGLSEELHQHFRKVTGEDDEGERYEFWPVGYVPKAEHAAQVNRLKARADKLQGQLGELAPIREAIGEDVEDLGAWLHDAQQALDTVSAMDGGQPDLEKLKAELKASYEASQGRIKAGFEKKLAEAAEKAAQLDSQLWDASVGARFASSPYFASTNGKPPKSLLIPEVAKTYFGSHFKRDPETGKIIATDRGGEVIYSTERPAEPADFAEAIERLIDTHPQRDSLLRAPERSGGDPPGHGGPRRPDYKTMTVADKVAYVEKHGPASLAKLVSGAA